MRFSFLVLVFVAFCAAADDNQDHYAGPEVCAPCHQAIYDAQAKTAMANTWQGSFSAPTPLKFTEGALHYEVHSTGKGLEFSVASPGKDKLTAPVSAMVGGKRHGVSMLLSLDRINGIPLDRTAMLEARYVMRAGSLILSPGFLKEFPTNYEDELGRVLSPAFERRCLVCHGQPETLGAGKQGGVRCESCHGPATAHVNSVTGSRSQPLVLPKHLNEMNSLEVCAQCHSGLSTAMQSDLMPEDMLVSRQVPALRKSECFIQSGEKLTCAACHNPHEDSAGVAQSSVPFACVVILYRRRNMRPFALSTAPKAVPGATCQRWIRIPFASPIIGSGCVPDRRQNPSPRMSACVRKLYPSASSSG
jgi:hypothetical protein